MKAEIAAAVRANYEAQRAAMVAGNADALGDLLADGFTLDPHDRLPTAQRRSGWPTSVRAQ